VSDSSFSAIVDDQLEVRTSVSISPQTGAAEPGALFTTEALPRATVLQFQVTALNSKNFRLPNGTTNGKPVERGISAIHDTVWSGLELIEFLGIGGINTRGMGRMRVFPHIRSLNV
jgi:CRISPR-associated protein Cmr4